MDQSALEGRIFKNKINTNSKSTDLFAEKSAVGLSAGLVSGINSNVQHGLCQQGFAKRPYICDYRVV